MGLIVTGLLLYFIGWVFGFFSGYLWTMHKVTAALVKAKTRTSVQDLYPNKYNDKNN